MNSLEPAPGEEGSLLSNPHLLRVEATKVTDYLLSSDHPKGAAKAKFFKGVGFSEGNVEEFVAALRTHAAQNRIADVVPHTFGVKTVIDCFMPTPSGKAYCIRSIWNDHQDGAPREPRLTTILTTHSPHIASIAPLRSSRCERVKHCRWRNQTL